jgi:hypothetical protein
MPFIGNKQQQQLQNAFVPNLIGPAKLIRLRCSAQSKIWHHPFVFNTKIIKLLISHNSKCKKQESTTKAA